MLNAAKDMVVSKAAKAYINDFIANYGSVRELKIDSKRRRIDVVCALHGEVSPIAVTIVEYRIDEVGPKKFIQIVDSSASRPWLQGVLRDFGHGRRFELPSWAASAL